MPDEFMQRLRASRPEPPSGLLDPNPQLLEEILMFEPVTHRRVFTPPRLAAVAAVAAALVAVALVVPSDGASKPRARAALVMRQIVESTSAALSSGRAHVVHVANTDKGAMPRQSGADFVVEFSGDNRSMYGTVDPGDGRSPAFAIANKVVDGRFYLQDGTRWVEDTNADLSGGDLFSVDPRNFLSGVAQAAQFEEVGTETVNGIRTRHLRATKLSGIPDFNLGLGPRGETDLTAFELWVDDTDIVRGLVVKTSERHESYPGALTKTVDGRKVVVESSMSEPEIVTITTSYKVEFADLGTPIEIKPPASASQIAGKG